MRLVTLPFEFVLGIIPMSIVQWAGCGECVHSCIHLNLRDESNIMLKLGLSIRIDFHMFPPELVPK